MLVGGTVPLPFLILLLLFDRSVRSFFFSSIVEGRQRVGEVREIDGVGDDGGEWRADIEGAAVGDVRPSLTPRLRRFLDRRDASFVCGAFVNDGERGEGAFLSSLLLIEEEEEEGKQAAAPFSSSIAEGASSPCALSFSSALYMRKARLIRSSR
jgi:hypothetical protein